MEQKKLTEYERKELKRRMDDNAPHFLKNIGSGLLRLDPRYVETAHRAYERFPDQKQLSVVLKSDNPEEHAVYREFRKRVRISYSKRVGVKGANPRLEEIGDLRWGNNWR